MLHTNSDSLFKNDKSIYLNRRIYIFSESDEAELVLNATDKKGFPISVINKRNRIAQSLLFDYPLYISDCLSDKKLSILIVGAGTLGVDFIKNAMWCGQFGEEIELEINVVDIDALNTKKILEHDCPEFFNQKWTGSHKHIRAKLHPCICTYDELDEIINVFDPHLKDYDTEFIKMIPKIIGLEESSINISNVKFILTEKK